jgi:hypothetical protein
MTKYYTIRELANLVCWKDVDRAIKYFYPTDHSHYEKLFKRIQKWPKCKTKAGEYLVVSGGFPDPNTEYWKKYGQKYLDDMKTGDEKPYYGVSIKKDGDEMSWSASFVKWKTIVNMPILMDTLMHYNPEEIVAHVIWEITFYGPEPEMNKHAKEVMSAVKEVKSGKAKCVPFDINKFKKNDNKAK